MSKKYKCEICSKEIERGNVCNLCSEKIDGFIKSIKQQLIEARKRRNEK